MINKLFSEESRLVRYGYLAVLVIVGIILTVVGYQTYFHVYDGDNLKPLVLVVGTGIYVLLMLQLNRLYAHLNLTKRKENVLIVLLCIAYFLVLCWFASVMTVIPQYDLNHLQKEASVMVAQGSGGILSGRHTFDGNWYFSQYPNQVPLLMVLYFVYRIGHLLGSADYQMVGAIFNCLCIVLTAAGVFAVARLKGTSQNGWLAFTIFLLNPVFYIYASYSYSDTICMPWAIWGIYVFLRFFEHHSLSAGKRIAGIGLSFVLLFIGYQIRATVIFLAVALCIYGIVVTIKHKWTIVCVMVLAFMLVSVGNTGLKNYFGIHLNQERAFPATHWVMMGTNTDSEGWYSDEDVHFTQSMTTYEAKKQMTQEKIASRLRAMGVVGVAELSFKKLASVWSSGDSTSSLFYIVRQHSLLYEYTEGGHNLFWLYLLQFSRCGLVFFMWFFVMTELFDRKRKLSPLLIAFFGAVLFYLVWEVHRRYSLNFLPWLFLIMVNGIDQAERRYTSVAVRFVKKHKMNAKRVQQVGCMFMLLLVIGLYGSGWHSYTATERRFREKIIYQPNANNNITAELSASQVSQTFQVKEPFNRLMFYFNADEKAKRAGYRLLIKDADGSILREKKFTYEKIDATGKVKIKFKKIQPNDMTQYTVLLMLEDTKPGDAISICTYRFTDMIPSGCAYFEGVAATDTDWKMKLYYVHKMPYTSPIFYGMLMVISCVVVVGCFVPRRKFCEI